MTLGMALCVALAAGASFGFAAETRQVLSFDRDWQFHLGDVPGAEAASFDASGWRKLDVPHDWSIEGPVGKDPKTMVGPFDPTPANRGDGSLNGGIGWYRKTFTLPEADSQKRIYLQFDGAYMDSDVWVNGKHVGKHPYGYTSFQFDLTPDVKFGADNKNVVAVRLNVQQPCSRWYSGAGIYRHVWLMTTDPVHIDHWGTYVTTPEITDQQAAVRIRTRVRNDSPSAAVVEVVSTIFDPDHKEVAQGRETLDKVAAGASPVFDVTMKVADPKRWSDEHPNLYQLVSEVKVNGQTTDRYTTPFGIRTIEFTTDKGFLLNGKHVDIKGVCNHHDLGCIGSAINHRALQRQLEILKTMGCNAIRTSHNPPAPEMLDLCDQMGFLVMDEAFDEWKEPKTEHGYGRFFDSWSDKDLMSMLHRDRNHPCVVLWSIGNEIPEQLKPEGRERAQHLTEICHREDPTRPVTSACHAPKDAKKNGLSDALDVLGINYDLPDQNDGKLIYETFKGRPLIASETASAVSTRGEYNLVLNQDGKPEIKPIWNQQVTSYDLGLGQYTGEQDLMKMKAAPWVAGEFVWTGFDYLGEPGPYQWPSRSSYFGIIDLCGFPKDRFYVYQSEWSDKPMVHLLPHWNWPGFEGKEIPVWCFTNGDSVELFLNGKSLGEKTAKDRKNLHFEWYVPYTPGTLKAVAKRDGKEIAVDEVVTAGKPAKLVLRPDRSQLRADREDLSFVQVRVEDKDGNLCPNADDEVSFKIGGAGKIVGVECGDPTNHEAFKAQQHRVFHGLGLVVVQPTDEAGEVQLEATSGSLAPASTTLSTVKNP
jgi:beta-galactosidase